MSERAWNSVGMMLAGGKKKQTIRREIVPLSLGPPQIPY